MSASERSIVCRVYVRKAISGHLAARILGVLALIACFPANAATQPKAEIGDWDELAVETTRVADPWQGFNRTMFTANEHLYRVIMRPLARGYERAVPTPARRGLTNFFFNLRFPVRFAGAVLQGKTDRAARETGRFVVNTVAGLGGFFRVSEHVNGLAAEPAEDVGQVLGAWGIASGPYVVLPIFGPVTLRDLAGGVGDSALTPIYWTFEGYDEWEVRAAVQATNAISTTPELLRSYDAVCERAIDPYAALRDAYAARRAAELKR